MDEIILPIRREDLQLPNSGCSALPVFGALQLAERLARPEKYKARRGFGEVRKLLRVFPRFFSNQDTLSKFPLLQIDEKLVFECRGIMEQLSFKIEDFFVGRTQEGVTNPNDPTRLIVHLLCEQKEVKLAALTELIRQLQQAESDGQKIGGRDTVVIWGMPDLSDYTKESQFREKFSHVRGGLDFGPNVVFVLPWPISKREGTNRKLEIDRSPERETEWINNVLSLLPGSSRRNKCVIIYTDDAHINASSKLEELPVDRGTLAHIQCRVQNFSLSAITTINEINGVHEVAQGDLVLMECLLHAAHLNLRKGFNTLTPAIVKKALQNYLQVCGFPEDLLNDNTLLQRLISMYRQTNKYGYINLNWVGGAVGHYPTVEDSGSAYQLERLLREATRPNSGNPLFLFEPNLNACAEVPVSVAELLSRLHWEARDKQIYPESRMDPGLARLLQWLITNGVVMDVVELNRTHPKELSKKVICASCGQDLTVAYLDDRDRIRWDSRDAKCAACGSRNASVQVEYIKR